MVRQLFVAVCLLTAFVPSMASGQQDNRPGIAVFPFTNGSVGAANEDLEALTIGIPELLLREMAENSALRIIERSRLRQVLEEQDLAVSGSVDPSTAAQVGRLLGARYLVTGTFIDLFGDFRMDARIIDGETGEILKTAQVRDKVENLYALLFDLAAKITEDVDLPPLPDAVREERREREIPAEAVTLFARAQVLQDAGRTTRAVELYRQITDRFPEMTQAQDALRQLERGG